MEEVEVEEVEGVELEEVVEGLVRLGAEGEWSGGKEEEGPRGKRGM